jgi:hypothetical protein
VIRWRCSKASFPGPRPGGSRLSNSGNSEKDKAERKGEPRPPDSLRSSLAGRGFAILPSHLTNKKSKHTQHGSSLVKLATYSLCFRCQQALPHSPLVQQAPALLPLYLRTYSFLSTTEKTSSLVLRWCCQALQLTFVLEKQRSGCAGRGLERRILEKADR